MASLYITEFAAAGSANGQLPIAQFPEIGSHKLTIASTSNVSAAFDNATNFVRVHTDAICSIKSSTSTSATATSTNARMALGQTEYFGVKPGTVIAVIVNT